MAVAIVRLGTPRGRDEGLRFGTVRRPPRGVRKADHARLNYYDMWLPALAPSAALLRAARDSDDDRHWQRFLREFRRELKRPDASQLLDTLAALSHATNFSVGCYCENAAHCHRSILREELERRGARFA